MHGQTSVDELAALLHRELDLPADEDLVWLALDRLDKAHLLGGRVQRPTGVVRASRRQVIQILGMAGALAVLLPVAPLTSAMQPQVSRGAGWQRG